MGPPFLFLGEGLGALDCGLLMRRDLTDHDGTVVTRDAVRALNV